VNSIVETGLKIPGCRVRGTLQFPDGSLGDSTPITSVHVTNVDAVATPDDTLQNIPEYLKSVKVIMGKADYSAILQQAEEIIKSKLLRFGILECWEVNDTISTTQIQATGRFSTAESARRAVSELKESSIPHLAGSKLFMNSVVSMHFNISNVIYNAINGDLDEMVQLLWDAGKVHLKAFPPTGPSQKLVCVHVYREDIESVAKANSALEKVLNGGLAMEDDENWWDDFFATSAGLSYLSLLGQSCGKYACREGRNNPLTLYGSRRSKVEFWGGLGCQN